MSERVEREWGFYLDDMIAFAGKVMTYTGGFDQRYLVGSGRIAPVLRAAPRGRGAIAERRQIGSGGGIFRCR